MYCTQCGKPVDTIDTICKSCGVPTGNKAHVTIRDDDTDSLMGAICFLVPLVGLILYLMWRDSKPRSSYFCGKWALVGFITGILISTVLTILFFVGFFNQFFLIF